MAYAPINKKGNRSRIPWPDYFFWENRKMKTRTTLVIAAAMMVIAATLQAGTLYEDFATTPDQYTLLGAAAVSGEMYNPDRSGQHSWANLTRPPAFVGGRVFNLRFIFDYLLHSSWACCAIIFKSSKVGKIVNVFVKLSIRIDVELDICQGLWDILISKIYF